MLNFSNIWLLFFLFSTTSCVKNKTVSGIMDTAKDALGPTQSLTDGNAFPLAGEETLTNLPMILAAVVRDLAAEKSPYLTCEPIPESSPNLGTDCTVASPEAKNGQGDFLHCYSLYYRDLENSPQAEREAETRSNCEIVAFDWPKVSDSLSAVIAEKLVKLGAEIQSKVNGKHLSVGNMKKISCVSNEKWSCEWEGFTSLTPYDVPFITPSNLPKAEVEDGAKDRWGAPLPKSTAEVVLKIGSEAIKTATFRASEADLSNYEVYLKQTSPTLLTSILGTLADYRYNAPGAIPANCREGELRAIIDYTEEGYKFMNDLLRRMRDGRLPERELTIGELARLKSIISATNCAKQSSQKVVVRGASLDEDMLARYVVGTTVQEPTLTSTTAGSTVEFKFRGNTTFYVLRARGADLRKFSNINPETDSEGEILIQAGTLFKVGLREQVVRLVNGRQEKSTKIILLQIP